METSPAFKVDIFCLRSLILGEFIKRYKRFFVDVKIGNEEVVAHCPNTGSMMGLIKKGNNVWLSKSNNPKRKLKYTLQIIEDQKTKVGINTHLTNKIVFEALDKRVIKNFENLDKIQSEVKFGKNTRFDFLITEKYKKTFIEVKNVTLSREKKIAEFPDAITERGLKHLKMLINSIKKGYKPYVLFLTQIQGINNFRIAKDIDSNYYKEYLDAKKSGVSFLAYRCSLNSKEIKIEKKIKILNE